MMIQHQRQSLRLKGYDYSNNGAYFVTICAKDRQCFLGNVVGGEMQANAMGQIVRSLWNELPTHYPGIAIDEFVIMPNHVHGIICIVGAQFIAPHINNRNEINPKGAINRAPTLGEIIRRFKGGSAYLIRKVHASTFAWQRNYHDHIIRNEKELRRIREYIVNNPLTWEQDENNPKNF